MAHRNSAVLLVSLLGLFIPNAYAQFGDTVQQFAQIAVGQGAVTSFVIHNPNSQEIDVTIDLFHSDGSALSSSQRHLVPGATMTVQTASSDPQISAGWARLSSTDRFTATEFFELTVAGQKLPMVGVLPSTIGTRARLFTFLSPGGTNTGLAIANPSSNSADLTVRLLAIDGTDAGTQTLTLGAREQRAQFINEGLLFPALTQFEGTVEVESTIPVVMLGLRTDAAGLSTIAAMMPSSTTLVDGSIQTQHLADAAVTTAKLADGSVTTPKLADAAVTTAKIAGNAVTTAQIADSSVGSAKIIDGSIGPQDLANGSITKAKLSATGGTSGQVLGTDGSSLAWQTVSGGGGGTLTLPFSGSGSTAASADLFFVNNTGSGRAIHAKTVSDTALWGISTSGVAIDGKSTSNDGVVGRAVASTKSGVWGTGTAAVGVTGMSSGNDGVVGVSTSTLPGSAGVRARNTGAGLAVFAEGDLYVTGASRGNIGPGGGGPFPRAAYDSGFRAIQKGDPVLLVSFDPGLPTSQYDSRKWVVDLQTQIGLHSGLATNYGIGGNNMGSGHANHGCYYIIETNNTITVFITHDDDEITGVRVRVWVCQ